MENKKYIKPNNQKGLYHTTLLILVDLLNREIEVDRAEVTKDLIGNANRTFALEIKYAELTKQPIRVFESKNFVEE
jgi:hypothetical protein